MNKQLIVVINVFHIPAIPSAAASPYRRFSVAGVILRARSFSRVILPSSSASLRKLPISSLTFEDSS